MASYMDYAVKNAEQTGMLMGKAADAFMGVEDEEAAVERLIRIAAEEASNSLSQAIMVDSGHTQFESDWYIGTKNG